MSKAINDLKEALAKANRDNFAVGDVVRWTSAGKYNYAAIKTEIGWFTTAREFNNYVAQQLTYETLIKVLSKAEVTDIKVATEWTDLNV